MMSTILYVLIYCISSSMKHFMSFAHFLIIFFVFLLLKFESSLYILDSAPLLAMGLANIISQCITFLFMLLKTFCIAPKFSFVFSSKKFCFYILYLSHARSPWFPITWSFFTIVSSLGYCCSFHHYYSP